MVVVIIMSGPSGTPTGVVMLFNNDCGSNGGRDVSSISGGRKCGKGCQQQQVVSTGISIGQSSGGTKTSQVLPQVQMNNNQRTRKYK